MLESKSEEFEALYEGEDPLKLTKEKESKVILIAVVWCVIPSMTVCNYRTKNRIRIARNKEYLYYTTPHIG